MSPIAPPAARRRRILIRSVPLVALAVGSFAVGALIAGGSGSTAAAERFAGAWERGDLEAMYAELSADAKAQYSLDAFSTSYLDARSMATMTALAAGEVKAVDGTEDTVAFDATVETRAFGRIAGRVELTLDGEHQLRWRPDLVFPGLREGEALDRVTRAPARARILTRDGEALAEGPAAARTSPLGASALAIAGSVGEPSRKQQRELFALGFAPGTLAGTSGLELAFNQRLAGQPGGRLLAVPEDQVGSAAGGRELAGGDPRAAKPLRTTIDSRAQEAAVGALGATYGGLAVLDAESGDVLGVAGLAFSAPQPPGSTFKMVTATAGLNANLVKLSDEFPVESSNSEIGREIPNANGELCGGSFVVSFARSCNTVFAPLGVRVGGEKLVATAEAFGFNSPPALLSEEPERALAPPPSTIPADLSESVSVGESAIGQGEVLATPLQMASVAQTIANGGKRMPTALTSERDLRPAQRPVRVMSAQVANQMRELMIAVVEQGTGIAADSPDYQVAGKTGTAELGPAALDPNAPPPGPGEQPKMDIDAWFAAFAPAAKPRYAVAAMVINAPGDGGTVAAPIVSQVLSSLLGG